MPEPLPAVQPEKLAQWHQTWRAVGAAAVAEDLAAPQMRLVVDGEGVGEARTRPHARAWLAGQLAKEEQRRWWIEARSWGAIGISVLALLVSLASALQ